MLLKQRTVPQGSALLAFDPSQSIEANAEAGQPSFRMWNEWRTWRYVTITIDN